MTGIFDRLAERGRGIFEHRLRLGVTGLSRSGKTVLLTALTQALLYPERLHGLRAYREGRYLAAMLRPQPNQHLPRFPFEANVARLTDAEKGPAWPESTGRQSELRVSIRYRPDGLAGRLGDAILNLDLFDYPGEWLLDLILLDYDYDQWSAALMDEMARPDRRQASAPLRSYLASLDPDIPDADAEQKAIETAALFRAYLRRRQTISGRTGALHPGRFLLPGELEDSPLLTFAPLASPAGGAPRRRRRARETLRSLMRKRYDAYLAEIVRPFHRRHFARLDRQLILIDALSGTLAGGPAASELDGELETLQQAMRLGRGWLPRRIRPSIDRVLFACTKADQLPTDQHGPLADVLRASLSRSLRRTRFGGAETKIMALAAVRATREVEARPQSGRRYLAGVPVGGQEPVAHYPGRIEATARAPLGGDFANLDFRPPATLRTDAAWPHIRLDRALEYLIGDHLR